MIGFDCLLDYFAELVLLDAYFVIQIGRLLVDLLSWGLLVFYVVCLRRELLFGFPWFVLCPYTYCGLTRMICVLIL